MISEPQSTHTSPGFLNRSLVLVIILAAISLVALFLRVWQLDLRPMHHDEANQAVRTGILLETGVYRYDPEDHHGPSLYYLSLPLAWLTAGGDFAKTTEITFRLVPALFGVAMIPMFFFLRRTLAVPAIAVAAFLTAVSPAMVFYSRFYIQETLLVFFTFGAIISGWLYFSRPSGQRAAVTGICLGLMFATKETSVLAFFAMAAGLAAVAATDWPAARSTISVVLLRRHLAWLLLPALGTAIVLFSSFFTHPRGILSSISSFDVYLSRAFFAESFHLHPWYFYLKTLLYTHEARGPHWTEAFILVLAAVGVVFAWLHPLGSVGKTRFVRFLSVYTLFLTLAYSAISYKTPWSLLSFHHGFILLAGFGAGCALSATRRSFRIVLAILLAAGLVHLTWLSTQANFKHFADPHNPYVYAHTSPDFLNLVKRIEQIAAVAPEGRGMLIEVIADPYSMWPLPWYLRGFSRVGYWEEAGQVPKGADPALIVTTPELQPKLPAGLDQQFQSEFYGLRPSVFLLLYIRDDLWERFIEKQSR